MTTSNYAAFHTTEDRGVAVPRHKIGGIFNAEVEYAGDFTAAN